ncbi:hypothetical protein CAPTEDRAFT_133964, partial [Capitella teleta]
MRFLIERGEDVNRRNEYGESPLHLAATSGDIEIVRMLLDAGADPNSKDHDEQSPLHCACSWMNCQHSARALASLQLIVQQLIEHGASVNAENIVDETPLHLSIQCTNVDIVRILFEAGSDDKPTRTTRKSVLNFAAENVIQHLIPPIISL